MVQPVAAHGAVQPPGLVPTSTAAYRPVCRHVDGLRYFYAGGGIGRRILVPRSPTKRVKPAAHDVQKTNEKHPERLIQPEAAGLAGAGTTAVAARPLPAAVPWRGQIAMARSQRRLALGELRYGAGRYARSADSTWLRQAASRMSRARIWILDRLECAAPAQPEQLCRLDSRRTRPPERVTQSSERCRSFRPV